MVWTLAWRSGKGRLECQGIPEVARGVFLEKIGELYYSAEVNRSAQIQRLVLYTGSFCFAPRIFYRCAIPLFLLYMLCPLANAFPHHNDPLVYACDSWQLQHWQAASYANFSNIVSSLGYSPQTHFSPPLPFPLFCFDSVVPAASPFFFASCP